MNEEDFITIQERWAKIDGQVMYHWRKEGEDEWHEILTSYNEVPIIFRQRLSREEFNERFGQK